MAMYKTPQRPIWTLLKKGPRATCGTLCTEFVCKSISVHGLKHNVPHVTQVDERQRVGGGEYRHKQMDVRMGGGVPGPFFMGPLKSLEGPLDKHIPVMAALPSFVSNRKSFFSWTMPHTSWFLDSQSVFFLT